MRARGSSVSTAKKKQRKQRVPYDQLSPSTAQAHGPKGLGEKQQPTATASSRAVRALTPPPRHTAPRPHAALHPSPTTDSTPPLRRTAPLPYSPAPSQARQAQQRTPWQIGRPGHLPQTKKRRRRGPRVRRRPPRGRPPVPAPPAARQLAASRPRGFRPWRRAGVGSRASRGVGPCGEGGEKRRGMGRAGGAQ